jgi:4-aminobutyrate aminotransferase / (S)-3-amino-2-methylpropionate transaminase / 5-aminovalerate transaminase
MKIINIEGKMKINLKTKIPGPKSQEYLKISEEYEPKCMSQQAPLVWEKAKGVTVQDVDGNVFIDMTSGVLVTNVGHCHDEHVKAIQNAVGNLMNCYDFPTPSRVLFSKKLVEITPKNLNKAFLVTTGSEATESAMRVAKRYTKKHEIISFFGGFHGRTYGSMSMAGKTSTKKNFGPVMPGCIQVPYPYCYRCPFKMKQEECSMFCVEYMDKALAAQSTGDIAALIVEPYQGSAGFIFPPDGFLTKISEWCKEKNIVFILDEVQASFGRTGKFFALEWENLEPNLLCLGKGIGSGIPTAALMAESRILEALEVGEMSSTTGGNPISCSAGLAVVQIMEKENLVANSLKIGKMMKDRLTKIAEKSKYIGDVRGRGLVIGMEFVEDKTTKEPSPKKTVEFIERCVQKGVIFGRVGVYGSVIRVAPPLVITEDEANEALEVISKVIDDMK